MNEQEVAFRKGLVNSIKTVFIPLYFFYDFQFQCFAVAASISFNKSE
jgi:hypothetical protein